MIGRLAVLLGLSRRPEHRWRRIAVVVASTFATVLILFGASFLIAVERQENRLEARTAYLAVTNSSSDLLLVARGSVWYGENFVPVMWIAPASDADPVLQPGTERLPEPGSAVVSPALGDAIRGDPDLAARFPSFTELGSDGLMDRNELIAWVRPEAQIDPASVTYRIAGFGSSADGDPFSNFAVETLPNRREAVVGVLGFIVLPAMLLLFLGLSAASSLRAERIATLHLLGAGRWWTTRLIVAESFALGAPPVIVVIAIWSGADGWISTIPILNKRLVEDDMNLDWPWLVGGAILLTGSVAGIVLAQSALSLMRKQIEVRKARRFSIATVGPVVLVLPIAVTIVAGINGNLDAFFLGLLATVVLLPIVLPGAVQPVAAAIAETRPVSALLAGLRLMASATRIGRPFTVLASVAIIVSVSYGYLQEVNGAASYLTEQGDGPSSISVSFRADSPGTVESLATNLAPAGVFAISTAVQRDEGTNQVTGDATVIAADCSTIAGALGLDGAACDPGQPTLLTGDIEERLRLAGVQVPAVADPDFVMDDSALSREVIVLSSLPEGNLRPLVEEAMPLDQYIGVQTFSAGTSGIKPPAKAAYVNAGILLAIVVVALAAYLAIVDRMIATIADRSILTVLGLTRAQLRHVEMLAFLIPYLSIVGGGILLGWINLWAFHRLAGGSPELAVIGWTASAASFGAVVGALAIGWLGVTSGRSDPSERTRWLT